MAAAAAAATAVITHYSIFLLNALIAFVFPIKNKQVTRYPIRAQWKGVAECGRGRGSVVGGQHMMVSDHSQLCEH